ncbi:retrovirus-related pol polyprotein from transposon TNT 1-94 [Tanacetum coccineum]
MATMAKNVIVAGAENQPIMLEKGMYDSWKTRIWVYIQGKEISSPEQKRPQTLEHLTPREKLRKSCDIKATIILLLGLLVDIYTLVNHHKTTKEIWDRVKELMEGMELTLQERESKLYDDFDRFTQNEVAKTSEIFMASLSPVGSINGDTVGPTYGSNILSEVPHYNTYHEMDVLNSVAQETKYTKHLVSNNDSYDEITSDINVISYTDYMITIENDDAQYVPPSEQDNAIILSIIEQMKSQVERSTLKGKSQVTPNETTLLDSKFQKLADENVSLTRALKHVETLQELLEQDRALKPIDENLDYACKFVYRIQELLVYVTASCPFTQSGNKKWALATSHQRNNKPYVDTSGISKTVVNNTQQYVEKQNTQKIDNTLLPSTRRVSYTNASGSQPKSNTRNDRIQRPSSRSENNKVKAQHRNFKPSSNKNNYVSDCNANVKNLDLSLSYANIVEVVLWYLDSGCSKHMTGQRDKLINFVSKFIDTVRFGNDHFAAIMVGKFCDSDIEVAFRKQLCFVRNLDGVDLLSGLVEAARTMLIFSKSPLFLWAEAVATVEDPSKLKPKVDIGIFIGYLPSKKAYRIYNKRTRMIIETIHVLFDELTQTAYEQFSSGPELQPLTSRHISLGLILNQAASTSTKHPSNNDLDLLFQLMFDEYLKPPSVSTNVSIATLCPLNTAVASSSTTIEQDAPSPSTLLTTKTKTNPIQATNVEEPNNEDTKFDSDTFTNPFAYPVTSSAKSSSRIDPLTNQVASTSAKPPSKNDLDLLFQPMFDEYFKHSPSGVSMYVSPATLPPPDTAGASPSTTIEQDAPSPSTLLTTKTTTNLILATNVKEPNNKDAEFDSDTFTNPFAPLVTSSAESSSRIFLLSHKFVKGAVDLTLFTQKEGEHILLNPRGIFINQSKYALEMLKKYGLENSDVVDTPMVERSKLDEDPQGTPVDPTHYRTMLTNYGFDFNKIPLYNDSKSVIALSCNTIQHSRTKHIAARYHFIKEQVENKVVELYFVKTSYQLADIFTKALARERFKFLINRLGMQSIMPKELKSLAESEEE